MDTTNKGRSPFYPGQPVPIDLFVGRSQEVERITRALTQVAYGKPQAVFLTGEYGIGKSSLAGYMRAVAERQHHIVGVHVLLGGAKTVEDVAAKTLQAVVSGVYGQPNAMDSIRATLARYVSKVQLFGVTLNVETINADAPDIAKGFLPFLRSFFKQITDASPHIQGLMLVLDEINGITASAEFTHFIKSLVDENGLSVEPLPLLLMLSGVEERRRDMVAALQSVERIFDIIDVAPMDASATREFFSRSFASVGMGVEDAALDVFERFSAGFPKIMHLIGDAAFWRTSGSQIDSKTAELAVSDAAEELGKKFIDYQVYQALRSPDYHTILAKIAQKNSLSELSDSFLKKSIEQELSTREKTKFTNFLQRMKHLGVLRSGSARGEYVFTSRMTQLYIFLKSAKT
jgi:hypothetical protein